MFFLSIEAVGEYLTVDELFCALVGAICHDVDHRGYNNAYMINTRDPISILHNDKSVRERVTVVHGGDNVAPPLRGLTHTDCCGCEGSRQGGLSTLASFARPTLPFLYGLRANRLWRTTMSALCSKRRWLIRT